MTNSVAEKMDTPRYSQSILRSNTESIPDTNITMITGKNHGSTIAKVILPFPNNITTSTGASWEQADAGLMAFMNEGKGNYETIKDQIASGVGQIDRKTIEMISNGVFGSNGAKGYQKRVGSLLNPARENYFRGSECRSIQLSFILIPLSKEDSQIYRRIIKTLQENCVPSVPDGHTGTIMHYPASWEIAFRPIDFLPIFKEAVLTNINIDYAATGKPYLHSDGAPVQWSLSLSFTELTILTKEDLTSGRSYG
jgi:hypothetical protein